MAAFKEFWNTQSPMIILPKDWRSLQALYTVNCQIFLLKNKDTAVSCLKPNYLWIISVLFAVLPEVKGTFLENNSKIFYEMHWNSRELFLQRRFLWQQLKSSEIHSRPWQSCQKTDRLSKLFALSAVKTNSLSFLMKCIEIEVNCSVKGYLSQLSTITVHFAVLSAVKSNFQDETPKYNCQLPC